MFVATSFLWSVARGSVDYGGLGRVINTVIATQAQGLAHSAVITCSPVDCSLWCALSLCHTRRHTPLREVRASQLKITQHISKLSIAIMLLSFGIMTFCFLLKVDLLYMQKHYNEHVFRCLICPYICPHVHVHQCV